MSTFFSFFTFSKFFFFSFNKLRKKNLIVKKNLKYHLRGLKYCGP